MLTARLGAVIALASVCAAQNLTSVSSSISSSASSSTSESESSSSSSSASRSSSNSALTTEAPVTTLTRTANQTVTITLVRNGSAEHCQAELEAWSSASRDYEPTSSTVYTNTSTTVSTSTIRFNRTYDCTMTCGSICYAGPVTTILETTEVVKTDVATYTLYERYPTPQPNCTIADDDCFSMKSIWSDISTAIYNRTETGTPTLTLPDYPKCTACSSTACTFQRGGVDLYFWPVTTSVSRDYCASEPTTGFLTDITQDVNHTFVPTTTGPYAVVNGITMYQGNVYLSINDPFVLDNCGNSITRASPGHNIVTIASTDLYSIRKYPGNLSPYPVNYDDFNPPTPWSAYFGQSSCANNQPACSVVYQDDYHPFMVMPPQIRNLDPNWAGCEFDKYGLFDPPTALRSVGDMFSTAAPEPTAPTDPDPVTTPATPGQSGNDGSPGPTATPDPEPTPPSTDPPANDPPATDPPANDPPATNPPTNDPPATNDPPVNNDPSTNNPPANNDPATNAPGAPNIPSPTSGQNPSNPNPNPNPTDPAANNPAPPAITIGTSTLSVDPTGGGLILNPSSTLNPGDAPVTVGDQTISVGPSGIVIAGPSGTSTITAAAAVGTAVPGAPSTAPAAPATQEITVGQDTFTVIRNSLVVGPGTTIGPDDPAVTVDGTTFSVRSTGVVVSSSGGGTTIVPQTITSSSSSPSSSTSTSTGAPDEFTGAGLKMGERKSVWSVAGLMGAVALLW